MLSLSGSAYQRHIDRANPLLVRVREPRSSDRRIPFDLEVCDTSAACDTDSVTINVLAPARVVDAAMNAIVKGSTRAAAGSMALVAQVTNLGVGTLTVCDTDVSWSITVNGSPTTGTVSSKSPGCMTVKQGKSTKFNFTWTYGAGEVTSGGTIAYTATVSVAGDVNAGNNSDTETRTATK